MVTLAMAASPGAVAEDSAGSDLEASPHEQGRSIYNFRCYYCHGYSGDAKTLASTYLNPRPRDFTSLQSGAISREFMVETVSRGREGTAMKSFANVLDQNEIALVVDFVRKEFIDQKKINTRYHTRENSWPDHERYLPAFPFATGEIALDTPWEELTEGQREGKKLFLTTCVTCHDRAHVADEGKIWDRRALSYPRFGFKPGDSLLPPDAFSGASIYAAHDRPLQISDLTPLEQEGERLFLGNCAFCHAADGTGRNWIGSFLVPHPRDLTSDTAMAGMTRTHLRVVIRDGLRGTSMPAWKSVLEASEIEAIIAYIHRAFHPLLPEGSGEAMSPN